MSLVWEHSRDWTGLRFQEGKKQKSECRWCLSRNNSWAYAHIFTLGNNKHASLRRIAGLETLIQPRASQWLLGKTSVRFLFFKNLWGASTVKSTYSDFEDPKFWDVESDFQFTEKRGFVCYPKTDSCAGGVGERNCCSTGISKHKYVGLTKNIWQRRENILIIVTMALWGNISY